MSASRIQVRPGIGHQWRIVRLRKRRDAGSADPRLRPKGAQEVFGGKGGSVGGRAPGTFGGRAPGSFGGRAPGSFGGSARWAPKWICTFWTISQDILPGLPIISIENIRARYLYSSNIVKQFSKKNVNR